jgi:hypothetical protein
MARQGYIPHTVLLGLGAVLVLSLVFNVYLMLHLHQLRLDAVLQAQELNKAEQRSTYWQTDWSICHHRPVNTTPDSLSSSLNTRPAPTGK